MEQLAWYLKGGEDCVTASEECGWNRTESVREKTKQRMTLRRKVRARGMCGRKQRLNQPRK